MLSRNLFVPVATAAVLLAGASQAATVNVFPGNPFWANPPSENGNGTGQSFISAAAPRSGAGSLELEGDRTRFFGLGNPYSQASNLGLLSDVTEFTYDWMVALDSSSLLHADYTPALRLHVWDNGARSELIWEGAYNGVYGNMDEGTWYTSGNTDKFHRFNAGIGPFEPGGALATLSIADWVTSGYYSQNAYIAAVSIGVGSSVGAGYHAFADNLTIGFNGSSTTYNFEVQVPEAGSSLILLALGAAALCGASVRRARA